MRKLSAIVIVILLALLVPSSFALAQTATPTPTATPDYRTYIPVGSVHMWPAISYSALPNGFISADGSCVLRADYPRLYAIYLDQFGACNGTTEFGLPNMNGRMPIGSQGNASPLTSYNAGDTGGANTATLTTTEMPAHGHTVTDPGHTHPPSGGASVFQGSVAGGSTAFSAALPGQTRVQMANTGSNTTGINVNSAGNGMPFSIMPPYFGINFVIWTGAIALPAASPPNIDLTVVVVFPSHTPTPTLTPSLTPTAGPSPTATATASPTGQPGYILSYEVGGQEVVMDYTVRPGDAFIGGNLFFIAGLILICMVWYVKRGQS